MLPFGDLVREDNRLIDVLDAEEYACCGVRLHGKGVFVREYKMGVDLKKKFVQHRLKAGDIVYSTLFAKSGAFAVAEPDVEGAIASEKFPSFRLVDDRLSLGYLKWFFRSGQLNRIAEHQATGMAAFSLSHLSKRKFLKLKVPVPSPERQADVVRLCEAVTNYTHRVDSPAKENVRLVEHMIGTTADCLFQGMPKEPLSRLGQYVLRPAVIHPSDQYRQVTVAMNHKGLRLRRVCEGREIKSPGQCFVRDGDMLFSRIDIRQGAIGFVGADLDGSVVTRDFPVYRLHDATPLARQFLLYVFRAPSFMAQAKHASRGTTGRKKMKRQAFLSLTVPWPTEAVQSSVIRKLVEVEGEVRRLSMVYRTQASLVKEYAHAVVGTVFGQDAGIVV